MKNPYETLGVAKGADDATIKAAYRKLARANHPDVAPDDAAAEERFKAASQAYAILSDSEKRAEYDEFGDVALDAGFDAAAARSARDSFRGFRGPHAGPGFDLDDLFANVFGGAPHGARPRMRRGPDLSARVTLDFLTATRGGIHSLELLRPLANGDTKPSRVQVRIPPGVRNGGRIRLAGKGGESPNGPAGDLLLDVQVAPHPFFTRDGRNLQIELPLTVPEAVNGGKVQVPTLEGQATVTIPEGTQGGSKLRLRGKGVPAHGKHAAGDLIATIRIRVPKPESETPPGWLAAWPDEANPRADWGFDD